MARTRLVAGIDEIGNDEWDALLDADDPGHPFLRHGFLRTLEATGCVGAGTGWEPRHLTLRDDAGRLRGAVPLYRKHHSFGEFVFDFAWAHAYHRLGLDYYPKLVAAIPFTPVTGPRLLAADDDTRHALAETLAGLPAADGASSLHLLFPRARDRAAAAAAGAVLRRDCHFLWHNRNYRDFDDFLARLSAKRRKQIRRERRRVTEAGIRVRTVLPEEVDDDLRERIYAFYARTYLIRGQAPYLTPDFFRRIETALPDRVRYFLACEGDRPVAAAFMLVGDDTLYGRHWGSLADYHSLHFETCYYAGIDYCIEHGLARFDAGAQGEHKIRRGFEPAATYSAHVVVEPALRGPIADFVGREGAMIADWHQEQRRRCAFPDADEIET